MSLSRVHSGLVQDKTVLSGDQRLTASLVELRAIIAGLAGLTLIKPEQFGAVPNDPAAAVANRTAIQNWLNAADTGILWHNPRNVYYVQTGTTPIKVTKRAVIIWCRLRPVVQAAAGQTLLEFSPTFGTAIPLASNQPVTRGMNTLTLAPLATPPAVGARVLVRAGQDLYTSAQAGWQQTGRVIATDASNPLAPTVTLDIAAPRAWGAAAASGGATTELVPITVEGGDNSLINFLDIDLYGQTNPLAKALRFLACKDIFIRRVHTESARAELFHFDAASEAVMVKDYYNRLPLTPVGGGVVQYHDFNNRIDFYRTDTTLDHVAYTASGYSRGAVCKRIDVQKYGTTAWGSFLLNSAQESEAMDVRLVNVIDDLDLGLRLAGQATGGKPPDVRVLTYDKDPRHLGCLPGYIKAKTIEGKLSILQKEIVTPAITTVTPFDTFLGRMWFPRVDAWLSDVTNIRWDLFTPAWDVAGGGRSRLNYAYEASEAGAATSPASTWFTFVDETNAAQNTTLGNPAGFNYSVAAQERQLRASVGANQPAGKRARLRLFGYPIKGLFVQGNTGA